MRKLFLVLTLMILAAPTAARAQTSTRPRVRASGSATISVKPDQLRINAGVVTKALTAQESAAQNAAQMEKVLTSLKQVLGPDGQVETITYSLTPLYQYSSGGTSTLTGYSTTNIVEARTPDLSLGGKLIDAATASGANTITGLRFTLKDFEPARGDALRSATRQAKNNAAAIASGLGKSIGEIVRAEESSTVRPATDLRTVGPEAGSTPVETGMVEVSATVIVESELQ